MRPPLRVPAPLLFLGSGLSQFFGAAVGIGLFALAPAHTVGWVRSVVGALIISALVRPWRLAWTRRTLAESALFGVILIAMNMSLYVAFSHLQLGVAVTLEFVGPILLAAYRARNAAGRWAALLAFAGVASISLFGLDWEQGSIADLVIGLAAVGAASGLWTAYIVLGNRIATQRSGQASLAVGMGAAVLIFAPITAPWAGGLLTPSAIGAALAMGVLTSVLPYMLDQVAIRRLDVATFALLNALLPASATIVGVVALRQIPGVPETLGLIAITIAVALATGTPPSPARGTRR